MDVAVSFLDVLVILDALYDTAENHEEPAIRMHAGQVASRLAAYVGERAEMRELATAHH